MKSEKVIRFGISIEKKSLDILETFMTENKFQNRSQAIRHLIASIGVRQKWDSNQTVGGSIVISYDHHKRDLLDKLTNIQHKYFHTILCSQHIHLNHDTCMEIIAVKGKAISVEKLTKELTSVKGIIHGDYSLTLVDEHEHEHVEHHHNE